MILGGIIAPLGLVVVLLGWYGASHTPNLFEQIPYLISGGLFGLGLVFLGSFFYFAHWLTELVKEHRAQSAAVIEAIARLEETVKQQAGADRLGGAGDGDSAGQPERRRPARRHRRRARWPTAPTASSSPARPACGASPPDDGLAACKLCDPYADGLTAVAELGDGACARRARRCRSSP